LDIKDEPHRQKEKAGGRLPLPLLIFRHSFVREEAETAKIFTAERNDGRTIPRVRQRLGKQNASDPLIQKGREAFGHTSGVYLGARMDA